MEWNNLFSRLILIYIFVSFLYCKDRYKVTGERYVNFSDSQIYNYEIMKAEYLDLENNSRKVNLKFGERVILLNDSIFIGSYGKSRYSFVKYKDIYGWTYDVGEVLSPDSPFAPKGKLFKDMLEFPIDNLLLLDYALDDISRYDYNEILWNWNLDAISYVATEIIDCRGNKVQGINMYIPYIDLTSYKKSIAKVHFRKGIFAYANEYKYMDWHGYGGVEEERYDNVENFVKSLKEEFEYIKSQKKVKNPDYSFQAQHQMEPCTYIDWSPAHGFPKILFVKKKK